jgi:S-(hydroxymethyl)glutathione dehydrogenase/alcohol dehydrogenase
MTSVAAMVFEGVNKPLVRETLDLAHPTGDQVLVRLKASGVCHSDLHILNGDWPMPEGPIVLGHEGSGIVEAVGPQVTEVSVGDHVVLSWFASCRRCVACLSGRAWLCEGTRAFDNTLPDGSTPLHRTDGSDVAPYLGVATFAEATVVPESAVVKIPKAVPFPVAALIGCAVTTGIGAVIHAASVAPGDSAVVIGCGGVGQAIVIGLKLVGADPIVAVDLSSDRLAHVRELGATHTVLGDAPDLIEQVNGITHGAEYAFEAIGRPQSIEMLPDLVRAGGSAVLVGLTATGARASFEPAALVDQGKSIIGCNYGNAVPKVDFARMAKLYLSGALPLDKLIGRSISLDQTNEAFDDLRAGAGLRTIIEYS